MMTLVKRAGCAVRLLAPVLGIAWGLPAFAQEVANKPDLRVGDQWTFHQTGDNAGKAVDNRWMRVIEEILPGDKVRVRPRHDDIDVYDTSWNPRHPDHPEFWPTNFKFPLRVGAAWSYASPVGARTLDGRNFEQRGQRKVVAYEAITVPAGTFQCFRIEGESHWIANINSLWAEYVYTERWLTTTWYCPDVNYMAKQHIERFAGKSYITLDQELVDYRRPRGIAPSAPPSSTREDTAPPDSR